MDCWDKLDADQAELDVDKAARDKKKADMAKRQPSSKQTKTYNSAVASNKALAAAVVSSDSDYSTCHVFLHGCQFTPSSTSHIALKAVFDQESVPDKPGTVLDSGAQVNIFKEPLDSAPAFSSQVLQELYCTLVLGTHLNFE